MGKTPVVGVRDRATNTVVAEPMLTVNRENAESLIAGTVAAGATIALRITVRESQPQREYVRGEAHTNGIESFWALFKRGYHGTHHWMSPQHLHRYCNEFAARHYMRRFDVLERIGRVFAGKRLTYKDLTASG